VIGLGCVEIDEDPGVNPLFRGIGGGVEVLRGGDDICGEDATPDGGVKPLFRGGVGGTVD